jgi:hypothetical protein
MSRGKGRKKPKVGAKVSPKKRPKRLPAGTPASNDPTVIWGLSFVDLDGPWGWSKIAVTHLKHVLEFMHNLESCRPGEVFGPKHKHIPLGNLCAKAQKRLAKLELDDLDGLWELRVRGLERIWGIRRDHVFYPVWWDPLHEVCPSKKKNT